MDTFSFLIHSVLFLIHKEQVTFEFSNIQVYFSERFTFKWSLSKHIKIGACSNKNLAFTVYVQM